MKERRKILKGIILCALMAVLLVIPQKDAGAASTSKEVKASWVKSGSYSVRLKGEKLYKKGSSKVIDSYVIRAFVSGNTIVYNTRVPWSIDNPYVNSFKTYNLKTKKKTIFYKDDSEKGGLYLTHYNNGYAYAVTTLDSQILHKVNVKTGKDSLVKLGVKYETISSNSIYKQYNVLVACKDWSFKKNTLCVHNTVTGKTKKIASNITGVNVIGGLLYYAVAGKTTEDGVGNATIYRCSIKGTRKKTVAKLTNTQPYTLAINKTSALYYNDDNKLIKYTYSSKKTSAGSEKTYNKVRRAMEG